MPDSREPIGRCPNCQAAVRADHRSATCSNCGNALPAQIIAALKYAAEPGTPGPEVLFKRFQSSMLSWDELFAQAGGFATTVGRERLVSISHSADRSDGVVTVWYWSA
jgi:hypothetical protein